MLNRVYDVRVAGAPAQVAFEAVRDFFAGRMRVALEQLNTGQNHAGSAVATLQTVTMPKAFLNRVQPAITRQTFDSRHLRAIRLDGQQCAGFYSLAIQQDRAGAANARFATNMGASELAMVAQKMNQQRSWLHLVFVLGSIDFDRDQTFHMPSGVSG
jgi:hypothetical protein